MAFDVTTHAEDGVLTVRLTGELDSRAAHRFNEVIGAVPGGTVNRLVLHLAELVYLSSAGLRCLVFAQQKLGRGTEIVLVGTRPEVAETITMTGFDRSVTMQDPVDS
ncbi:STAS domain-containing protein [Actinokineospora auranticolor]|uniref:Anti-sigma factor antagonist n=1 Tax=Actinokineospora auranticolor TaxID=155976 RepID=A0A2S6GJV9_9PSEU|nr:STAS domain-containing protein [Actinokineospora auranticolor]PPK65441.1 anti-sigma B factor antagonist [Actinokineospora auranticolor]